MSKWSKLKVALLTAVSTLSALQLGGCLGADMYNKLTQYVVIGNLFD